MTYDMTNAIKATGYGGTNSLMAEEMAKAMQLTTSGKMDYASMDFLAGGQSTPTTVFQKDGSSRSLLTVESSTSSTSSNKSLGAKISKMMRLR